MKNQFLQSVVPAPFLDTSEFKETVRRITPALKIRTRDDYIEFIHGSRAYAMRDAIVSAFAQEGRAHRLHFPLMVQRTLEGVRQEHDMRHLMLEERLLGLKGGHINSSHWTRLKGELRLALKQAATDMAVMHEGLQTGEIAHAQKPAEPLIFSYR